MAFEPIDLVEQQDECLAHLVRFPLWPAKWQAFTSDVALSWTIRKLEHDEKENIPSTAGIYSLLIQPAIASHPACSYLMYVGQAQNLQDRFYNYLTTEQRIRPKVVRLLHKWRGYIHFCYSNVPVGQLTVVEDALLDAYIPPVNSRFPGQLASVVRAFQ